MERVKTRTRDTVYTQQYRRQKVHTIKLGDYECILLLLLLNRLEQTHHLDFRKSINLHASAASGSSLIRSFAFDENLLLLLQVRGNIDRNLQYTRDNISRCQCKPLCQRDIRDTVTLVDLNPDQVLGV